MQILSSLYKISIKKHSSTKKDNYIQIKTWHTCTRLSSLKYRLRSLIPLINDLDKKRYWEIRSSYIKITAITKDLHIIWWNSWRAVLSMINNVEDLGYTRYGVKSPKFKQEAVNKHQNMSNEDAWYAMKMQNMSWFYSDARRLVFQLEPGVKYQKIRPLSRAGFGVEQGNFWVSSLYWVGSI